MRDIRYFVTFKLSHIIVINNIEYLNLIFDIF